MMAMWDLLVQPHSSMPCVQKGLDDRFVDEDLVFKGNFDFRPMSQFHSLAATG
jgi:hypothetical protein